LQRCGGCAIELGDDGEHRQVGDVTPRGIGDETSSKLRCELQAMVLMEARYQVEG